MAGALSGDVLPPQVIYKGKTDACHAKYNFPDDWDVTHTENHWANKDTSFRYLDKIIVPNVNKVRDELDLPLRQKALIILDFFSAQLFEEFRERLSQSVSEKKSRKGLQRVKKKAGISDALGLSVDI